jgi:outer membrane usher protein
VGSFAQTKVLLKVVVNTVDKGEHFLQLTDDGDILCPDDTLKELGIRAVGRPAPNLPGFVSLRSLAPDVGFEMVEGTAELRVTANPAILETRAIDFGAKKPPDLISANGNSALLDYYMDYSSSTASFTMPLELGVRLGPVLFLSDATMSWAENASIVRGQTSMIFDDRARNVRYTAGDFFATSGYQWLGSSGFFGGLSVARNFSLDPYSVRRPEPVLTQLIATPSMVELYLNDMRVGSDLALSPGSWQFVNAPLFSGLNNVALVIRDGQGNVSRVVTPVYSSTQVLGAGIDEFSYSVGFKRDQLGVQSFTYGDPAFLGFHRIGLTDWLTGGLRAEASPTVLNGGPCAAFTLGVLGEMSVSGAVSYASDTFGYGSEVGYSFQAKSFGIGLSLLYQSDGYAGLFSSFSGRQGRLQGSLSLRLSDALLGSLSAVASYGLLPDGTDTETLTLTYSRQLWRNMQFLALMRGTMAYGRIQYYGFAGTHVVLGGALAGVNYTSSNGSNGLSAQVNRSAGRGTGFGYSVAIAEAENWARQWQFDGDASVTYNGHHGIYTASASYNQAMDWYGFQLDADGSIVLIDNSLQFARPVTDGFALVRVDDMPGVRVKYFGDYIGVTDKSGRLLVPGLASYSENDISIEPSDAPLNTRIDSAVVRIAPPYRGGAVLDFKPIRFQAIAGKLFFLQDGKRTPVEYAGLELTVGTRVLSSIVGMGGAFYLEDVPPGTYRARLFTENKESLFDLVVPQSTATIVDLGEIEAKPMTTSRN